MILAFSPHTWCSSFHAAVPLLLLLMMMMMIVPLPPMVEAWTPAQSSSFIGDGRRAVWRPVCTSMLSSSLHSHHSHHGAIWTMYQEEEEEEISSSGTNPMNAWTVLSTTERWICRTLDQTNHAAAAAAASTTSRTNNNSKNNNPYVRKEISYYCEAPPISDTTTTTSTTALVLFVASLFRHLKEIRHIGEQHIQYEMKLQQPPQDDDRSHTSSSSPVTRTTLRQTHVIVVPFHTVLSESFVVFDTICQTIQQMRRHARDYYYHKHPTSSRPTDNEEDDYSISINCAHLHPLYGPPPRTTNDNDNDEYNHDPKYREYQQQRLLARQSPYPTIVMEVRVTPMIPPLEFVSPPTPSMSRNHHHQDTTTTNQNPTSSSSSTTAISWSDIQKLEALFGQSAYLKENNHHIETVVSSSAASSSSEWTDHPSAEDSMDVERTEEDENYLWDHVVGNTLHEIVVPPPVPFIRTPIQQIQEWSGRPTPTTTPPPQISSVTTTNTTHADEAYEYVFTNIAMLLENDDDDPSSTARYYLVFSHFLLHAATSFEQFTTEVQQLYTILQQVDATYHHQTSSSKLTMTTYHPEHIQSTHRSPFPLLVLERTENMIRS